MHENSRNILFSKLKQKEKLSAISLLLHISQRTLKEWEKGRSTIPEESFKTLTITSGMKTKNFTYDVLPENWNASDAARKGGLARVQKYGNPGTNEGRKKGGIASMQTHNKFASGFHAAKPIFKPKQSKDLAEMLGILVGDGHLSDYQTSMTTSSITDLGHASFVSKLFKKLFKIEAPIQKNSRSNSVDVIASSKKLVDFLVLMGMIKGHKIHNGLRIPEWILEDKKFWKPFIRGLFDTDGCVYLDRHYRENKTYKHIGWTISSNADKLIIDIISVLKKLGYSPSYRESQHSVYLRKQMEISRYFEEIGTHNPKHLSRYRQFKGEVA